MSKVYIYNFVPVMTAKAMQPVAVVGKSPDAAARAVWHSCKEKMGGFEIWAQGIRKNCIIASDHPYRKLLVKHSVPSQDHLWTLGAIAFGTRSSWIVFSGIVWDNGTRNYPEKLDQEWSMASAGH